MPEPRAAAPARPIGQENMFAALESMTRTANDAIVVTDLDARVVIWNPAAELLFGVPTSLALGATVSDLTESIVVGSGEQGDPRETAITNGSWRGRRIERARVGPDAGREVIVEAALSRLETADGTVVGVISIRRDVTASVRLEQEFAALGTLATTTGVARTRAEVADGAIGLMCAATGADFGVITRHDGDEAIVEGSRGLAPDLKSMIQGDGVSGSPLAAALSPPGGVLSGSIEQVPMRETSREILRASGIASLAAVGLHRQGELVGAMALGWSNPTLGQPSDAALLQAAAHVEHALENIRLVEGLIASERRYRTLFDESPEALLLETWTGEIVDANAAALRTFRTGGATLVGRSGESITGATSAALRAAHATSGSRGQAMLRSTGTTIDGRPFPIDLQIAPVEIDGTSRLLVLVRDLSAEAQLQAELVQAQKMDAIGQLVSGVAHELNNPLAAIIAFSQLIRRDPDLPEELRRDADVLNQEADRTRRIVDNLLDFARQRPPERRPTRLDALVRTVLELQAYSLSSNRIEVTVDIPTTLPPIPIDRSQLQQVLLNLTRNAIQAIASDADRGTIKFVGRSFEAGPQSGPRRLMVRLSITDDGPGVGNADRDRLFMPFFTTKPPGEGTGLGLSVSFGIVAAHTGHLRYEPAPEGRGATFALELPVELDEAWARDAEAAGTSMRDEAWGKTEVGARDTASTAGTMTAIGATVLVLDDEPSIRRLLSRILGTAGIRPVTAVDGFEAIEIVRGGAIDAVVCDHRMAGMSGIDVYRAIIELDPTLAQRFIFMSGDVLNPELTDFARAHRIGLLAKPFDVETAVGAVEDLVRDLREPRPDQRG